MCFHVLNMLWDHENHVLKGQKLCTLVLKSMYFKVHNMCCKIIFTHYYCHIPLINAHSAVQLITCPFAVVILRETALLLPHTTVR